MPVFQQLLCIYMHFQRFMPAQYGKQRRPERVQCCDRRLLHGHVA